MNIHNRKALTAKMAILSRSCILLFVVYSPLGLSDDFYVTPIVGQWKYDLCYYYNHPFAWASQCTNWDEGTWSSLQCLDMQDSRPWDDESKLVSKSLAYPGGVSAIFHGWLNKGESLPYNGCWNGPAAFKFGFEYGGNAAPISIKQEDGTTHWTYGTRYRDVTCPLWTTTTSSGCLGISEKNLGRQCDTAGNPITVATGNKYQYEIDINSSHPFGLTFKRYYNSQNAVPGVLGYGWRHEYAAELKIDGESIKAIRSDGKILPFNAVDGQLDEYSSDADVDLFLSAVLDSGGKVEEYHLKTARDEEEIYDNKGKLISIADSSGHVKSLIYDIASTAGGDDNSETLDKVVSVYGTEMYLKHDTKNRVVEILLSGHSYNYEYDANGSLVKVILPDHTGDDDSDNQYKKYHYEQVGLVYLLTGITDENGNRYATWSYDEEGRAISSEHANGVDKTTLTYNADGTTTVTNPLGKQTTYHFTTIHGVKKVIQVEGHPTTSCEGANRSYSYDANGNIASKTDWNGVTTTYTYDTDRNLELSRTEAVGTPQERTTTTEWHTDFRLPTKITEPGKVTEYTYDAKGRQLSSKVSSVQ